MAVAIRLGNRLVGPGQSCFVVAEVGVNHNGHVDLAHQLIDVAVSGGADAVKFQTFSPGRLAAVGAPLADYQRTPRPVSTQGELLGPLALDESAHRDLKAHADEAGVLFLSSTFDEESLDLLVRIGVRALKIPSGELTNHQLLRRAAESGLPILMSTGMSTLEDIDAAVGQLEQARDRLALLHCVSSYPTRPEDCNLRAIELMRARYRIPIGWSDHTEGIIVAIAAVALGADLIEKHITLDRNMPGPDHRASIEPDQLRAMVEAIRVAQTALGSPMKEPSVNEIAMAGIARKSLHWRRGLGTGEVVGRADLVALRPGTGIAPGDLGRLEGRAVVVPTVEGAMARWEDVGLTGAGRA